MSRKDLPQLTRKLALLDPQRESDGCGGFTETWLELGKLWAEVLPRSGRAQAEGDLPLGTAPVRITVRAVAPGSPQRPRAGQVFAEGTRRFEIQAVVERDAAGRFLSCFAQEKVVSL